MKRSTRAFVSAALVASAALLSFAVARGARKPFSSEAPAHRRQGAEDSEVVIVEFSDFECPACRVAEAPLKRILAFYEGKVRLVFKHFPLPMHRWARSAALAAECAGRQGRFWDYHHLLYDRQDDWAGEQAEQRLEAYARQLKLDVAVWQACRRDPGAAAAVDADREDGRRAWVGSTPTFFINGRRFAGAADLGQRGVPFIENELKR